MPSFRELSERSPDAAPVERKSKPALNPLFRKQVRYQFKSYVLCLPSGLFLFLMVDPLVPFWDGVEILFWFGVFCFGIQAFTLAGHYGYELKKQKKAQALAEEAESNWVDG